jgi:hypothetical protein
LVLEQEREVRHGSVRGIADSLTVETRLAASHARRKLSRGGFWVGQRFTAAIPSPGLNFGFNEVLKNSMLSFDFGWRSGSPLR